MPFGWAALGTAVIGAVSSSNAAGKAANAQQQASQNATQEQQRQFDINNANLAPYRAAGTGALSQLTAGTAPGGQFNRNFSMKDFNADPGYQFRMDQGSQALQRSAAAGSGILNGGTLKALTQYGQNFASNEYSNAYNRFNNDQTTRFNRLSGIAGTGQTAVNTTGQLGANTANQISSNMIGAGNAQAAGYVGQANAVNSGISSLGNFYMQQQYANAYGGGGSSGVNPYVSSPSAYVSGTPYGSGANSGNTYCDYHLKTDIEPYRFNGMSRLQVYEFRFKEEAADAPKQRGYLAQEVQALYPEAVSTGPNGFLMVDYAKLPGWAELDALRADPQVWER